MPHDWFSKLTGFREESYELTRSRLVVEGDELVSTVIGTASVPSACRHWQNGVPESRFPAPNEARCWPKVHKDSAFTRRSVQLALR
jgi:hypothetical protein